MQTSLLIDHQVHATEAGTVVRALLTISGTAPEEAGRPTLGLSLVLDRSGSMEGAPLEAVREAAARAVERLHPADIVAAVAFDTTVNDLGPVGPAASQPGLAATLRALTAGAETNLSGGWLRGREQMAAAADLVTGAGSTRRIVLLTDGHANRGITEPDALMGLAREARAQGITTTTVGVGDGYDDGLLRAMADAGGGNAWYIERPDQAQDIFAEELANLLAVAAQGVRVTLTLHDPVSMLVVHSDWPSMPGTDRWRFDLGDLYASDPKPLLLELFVPRGASVGEDLSSTVLLATLTVHADVLVDGGGVEHRQLTLPIAATAAMQEQVVPEIERAVLLARTARFREDAALAQRAGDALMAQELMRDAVDLLRSRRAQAADADGVLARQIDDLEELERQYKRREFSEFDAKYQLQRSQNLRRGKHRIDEVTRRPR